MRSIPTLNVQGRSPEIVYVCISLDEDILGVRSPGVGRRLTGIEVLLRTQIMALQGQNGPSL